MKKSYIPYIAFAVVAFIILSVFSYTTSPFYAEPSSMDSAIFQIIGKGWSEGILPYVGLWDCKGPLIFFINCLGYLLTGNGVGIFLIQWLSLFLSISICFYILKIGYSTKWSCFLAFFCAITLAAHNLGGNGTEEYLLPLLALSYYFIYKWLDNAENNNTWNHPAVNAIVYGLVLAFSLLTRLTNVLGVCAAVAVISFCLMIKGRWKNLGANILCFLLGFFILFSPFWTYFHLKGTVDDFWYGTVLYNLDYAQMSEDNVIFMEKAAQLLIRFLETWIPLATAILMLLTRSRRTLTSIVLLVATAIPAIWFLSGLGFAHYGIISIPLVFIAFLELKRMAEESRTLFMKTVGKVILVGYILVTIFLSSLSYYRYLSLYSENADLTIYRDFLKDVPSNYKDSFVSYNCNPDFYLYDGISPACRFFTLQDFESSCSPSLQKKMQESFRACGAKWLMVRGEAKMISPILRERYQLYKRDCRNKLTLYMLQ